MFYLECERTDIVRLSCDGQTLPPAEIAKQLRAGRFVYDPEKQGIMDTMRPGTMVAFVHEVQPTAVATYYDAFEVPVTAVPPSPS